jgi:hypothetical protein
MIEKTIERWHRILRGELPGGLEELLADACVFHSPILFTPQKGKPLTKMYLEAAAALFSGDASGGALAHGIPEARFRYVKQVLSHPHAVLEFEATVDGKVVNGIDMITCDDAGRIVEFKVMIRPLQAVHLLHEKMAALLAAVKPKP